MFIRNSHIYRKLFKISRVLYKFTKVSYFSPDLIFSIESQLIIRVKKYK